jgi:Zn-dependent protease
METDTVVRIYVIALVIYSTSLHEMAHAFTAHWLGDPTPGRYGRLTFNPLAHLQPALTAIIFPALFYLAGGGLICLAMTPVNPSRFRHPLRDQALVGLVGPATNLLCAAVMIGILWIPGVWNPAKPPWLMEILKWAAWWNIVLAAFNLLPIPPLDGYSLVRGALPLQLRQHTDALGRMGMMSLMLVLMAGSAILSFIGPALVLLYSMLLPRV